MFFDPIPTRTLTWYSLYQPRNQYAVLVPVVFPLTLCSAQEAHAKAILEASGNVCDIRFKLCPARLSDEV